MSRFLVRERAQPNRQDRSRITSRFGALRTICGSYMYCLHGERHDLQGKRDFTSMLQKSGFALNKTSEHSKFLQAGTESRHMQHRCMRGTLFFSFRGPKDQINFRILHFRILQNLVSRIPLTVALRTITLDPYVEVICCAPVGLLGQNCVARLFIIRSLEPKQLHAEELPSSASSVMTSKPKVALKQIGWATLRARSEPQHQVTTKKRLRQMTDILPLS